MLYHPPPSNHQARHHNDQRPKKQDLPNRQSRHELLVRSVVQREQKTREYAERHANPGIHSAALRKAAPAANGHNGKAAANNADNNNSGAA